MHSVEGSSHTLRCTAFVMCSVQ